MVFTLNEVLGIITLIFFILVYINDLYNKKKKPPSCQLSGYFIITSSEATVIGALRYYYSI